MKELCNRLRLGDGTRNMKTKKTDHQRMQQRKTLPAWHALLPIGATLMANTPAAFADTGCAESGPFTVNTAGIPTAPVWGIVTMTLLILTAASIVLARRWSLTAR
jgi:hypothetical protein